MQQLYVFGGRGVEGCTEVNHVSYYLDCLLYWYFNQISLTANDYINVAYLVCKMNGTFRLVPFLGFTLNIWSVQNNYLLWKTTGDEKVGKFLQNYTASLAKGRNFHRHHRETLTRPTTRLEYSSWDMPTSLRRGLFRLTWNRRRHL